MITDIMIIILMPFCSIIAIIHLVLKSIIRFILISHRNSRRSFCTVITIPFLISILILTKTVIVVDIEGRFLMQQSSLELNDFRFLNFIHIIAIIRVIILR